MPNNYFSMKSIKMWLTLVFKRSRLNLCNFISLCKYFIESTLQTTIMKQIHCTIFYLYFYECPFWWRLRFQILEGMTHHLEVKVTWEQHKTPWEVWTFTWWKGEPLEMNGLDAAQGFESGKSIHTSSWKIAWETTHWRPINHVTGYAVKVLLTLENLGQ